MALENPHHSYPAWIEIDLHQFQKNLHALKKHIGKAKFCLPIKGNAYGHGMVPIARSAEQAGIDYLGVSSLHEAMILHDAGIKMPILVFGAIHEEQMPTLLEFGFEVSISSKLKATLLEKYCKKLNKTCKIHLEIDTGMQRTGVRPSTALQLLNLIDGISSFKLAGVYSHLATADKPNDPFANHQIQIFKDFIDTHVKKHNPDILCHIANSGGTCYYPESHLDMVRPGLIAYGYFPSTHITALSAIRPIFSVHAKIAYSKVVEKNQGISYGHTYTTSERTHILTIPVGYGDGYRRTLSNKGQILIHNQRFPIVGTICMDQFMVNISQQTAHVGEKTTLIGQQGEEEISLEEIAQACNTIPYEILCGFNDRLPRFYKK